MASDQFGPSNKAALPSYAQLCRLLVDCGSQALRVIFDRIYPPEELCTALSHDRVQTTLKLLFEKKILSPAQWEMVYPVVPSFVTSAKFDPTLLMVLLRSICNLRSPAKGWDNFPSSTDKNIEDDIARLRCYRNLFAHSTEASFDCSTFGGYWQDIRDILMRLGLASYGNAIDQLKSIRMDPDIEEHYKLSLKQWERDEDDIKKKVSQMKEEMESLMEKNHHGGISGSPSMASAPSPFASSKETTNYARLCRLLVDVGSKALRDRFDKVHPPSTLHGVLLSNKPTLQPLYTGVMGKKKVKKVLNPTQWGKLYTVHSPATSASFDITLLTVLLRNICGFICPAAGWDNLPPPTDTSTADDIARVKYYRNTVYGHANQASVDDASFNAYWQAIREALVRLGGTTFRGYIDNLEHDTMDPDMEEHFRELMKQWKKDDDSIKEKLEEIEDAAYPANLIDDIRELYKVDRGWRSPFPWREELNVHLDDITVRLSTSSMKTNRKMSTREIDMSHIFKVHDGCTQLPKRILVQGESGCGKSSLCQKLCYDWSGKTKDGLRKFELVLLLKCYDIKGDLWEAIDNQLLPSDVSTEERERFFQYIRNTQSKVLLVLDGLDELPSNKTPLFSEIIQGRDLPNCKILATSQETAGKEVENLFDTLLEIQGFIEEDARIFISKHFKRIRPCLVAELLQKAKPNHMFKDSVVNPLTTALLCLLCEDFKGHLPESKTQLYLETTSSVLRRYSLKEGVFTSSENFTEIYKAELLQLGSLAFSSLLEKKRYLEENELSSDILKIGFLSTESSHLTKNSRYFFIHKSIQEFLAAFYLSHQLMCGEMDPEVVVVKHFHELKGVLSFTTGLIRKEDTALCLMKSLAAQINRVNINKDKELFHSEDYLRVSLDCIGECVQENRSELVRCLGSHLTIEEVAFCDGGSGDRLHAELLKANKTLKKLKLCKSGNRGDWDNIPSSLAEVLQSNTTLTNLELSGFGEEDALQVFEALETNTTLNRLQLCGSIIGASGACSLAMSLKVNSSLTTLDLSDNEIGFSGVCCLAEVLKVNTTLTKLNLSANNIGDLAVVTLSESLKSNTTLTSLYLSSNSIGVYGVRSLVEALTVNASLMILDLSENEIGDPGAVAIAQALKENTNLAVLNLSQNGIGDVAALVLAEALKTNASLTTLGLQNNKISSSGAKFLADALKVNTKLSSLDLSTNYIDDTGARCLAEALKHKE